MARPACTIRQLLQRMGMLCILLLDAVRFLRLCLHAPAALTAENLFLRKQLALYQERHTKPRRATDTTRFTLIWLSQWCDWQPALTVVQPETFRRWRRQGLRQCWRSTPSPGRPLIPGELQALIRQMAHDNLTWGQQRIANALRLKLGLPVSPRTVRKYMPTRRDRGPSPCVPSQRWRTFVRNHAGALISSSMAAELLTRGAQAVSARIRWFLQRWWGHAAAHGMQGSAPREAVTLVLLLETRSTLAAWFPGTVEVLSEDDRSPPEMRPPGHHDPFIATRAPPVDTLALRPVVGVDCGWNRANAKTRSAKPLNKRASQATPVQQAA
jgi:homeodomain-containing protein